jgi:molybdopterin-guanine dinucleotide biosynthesis protein A
MVQIRAMNMHPAIILAGGRSSRMGGGQKSLLEIGGQPMIRRVITRAEGQCGPLALNANGDPSAFPDLGLPILRDTVPDLPGPLAGVLVGMDWAAGQGARHVISIAADTPFFPLDLCARLSAASRDGRPVMAATRMGDGEIVEHPTFALWPVALREDLRAALGRGDRRVRGFARDHGASLAIWEVADCDPFFNVNTPEDLARAEVIAAGAA